MRAYRIRQWDEDGQWEQIERPEPGFGEALVRVEACGVGRTVLNYSAGTHVNDPDLLPRTPGHEFSGRVVAVGAGVTEELIGRQVVSYFYLFCGSCAACLSSREPLCENLAGWVGINRDGGYAEYAALPARNLVPVPDGLDAAAATVVPDAVATSVHVCRSRTAIGDGDRVVVVGAGGGVGMHLVQLAALMGAVVVGIEEDDDKLDALANLGVAAIAAKELTGGSAPSLDADVVVDLVGSSLTLRWSLNSLSAGGRMVVLTGFPDQVLSVDGRDLVFRETSIIGSRYASRREVLEAADLVSRGDIQPVIGRVVEPERVAELHAALRAKQLLGRGAIRWEPSFR